MYKIIQLTVWTEMTWKSTKLEEWGLQPRSNKWDLTSICLPCPLAGCGKWWRGRYGPVPRQTWRNCTIDGRSIIYQLVFLSAEWCRHTWSFSWGTPVNAEIKFDLALRALLSQQHFPCSIPGYTHKTKGRKANAIHPVLFAMGGLLPKLFPPGTSGQ